MSIVGIKNLILLPAGVSGADVSINPQQICSVSIDDYMGVEISMSNGETFYYTIRDWMDRVKWCMQGGHPRPGKPPTPPRSEKQAKEKIKHDERVYLSGHIYRDPGLEKYELRRSVPKESE